MATVAGMLAVAAFSYYLYLVNKREAIFVPVNYYYATLFDGLVLPYPKEYNFGVDGIWLQPVPFHEIPFNEPMKGSLRGSEGEEAEVWVIPKSGVGLFVKLPTRPTTSSFTQGETLDFPVGLHHFSRVTFNLPQGGTRQYAIGHLWLEILPKEGVLNEQDNLHFRVFWQPGQNPSVVVMYRNVSSRPVTLTGIRLPEEFPYGLDRMHFWTETTPIENRDRKEEVVFDQAMLERLKPHLPLTERVLASRTTDFPQPVTVEPGYRIIICFALAATTSEAHRTFVDINPIILRTVDGGVISSFSGPIARGLPQRYDPSEIRRMLER